MEEHKQPDPREAVEGPEGEKLAPAGNSNARIFVPPEEDQEEHREERGGSEDEGQPGEGDDAS